MLCARCNSKSTVIDSERRADRSVYRRRRCLKCEHEWKTYEVESAQILTTAKRDSIQQKIGELIRGLENLSEDLQSVNLRDDRS